MDEQGRRGEKSLGIGDELYREKLFRGPRVCTGVRVGYVCDALGQSGGTDQVDACRLVMAKGRVEGVDMRC